MLAQKARSLSGGAADLKDVAGHVLRFVQALHQERQLSRRKVVSVAMEHVAPERCVPEKMTQKPDCVLFQCISDIERHVSPG